MGDFCFKPRRIAFLMGLLFLLSFSAFSQTLLLQESFEGGDINYDANTFSDGSSDYFIKFYNGMTPPTGWPRYFSNIDGTYFFAAEDIENTDNPLGATESGYIVLKAVDISSYNTVRVKVALAAVSQSNGDLSFEQEDGITIEYAFDGNIATEGDNYVNTGTYTAVGAFHGSNGITVTDLYEDTNLDGQGDGTTLTETFQDFTYEFSTSGATNVSIRVKVFSTTGSEEIGVDNIRIYGVGLTASAPTVTTTAISTYDATSATMGGNVTTDGGATVTERGVVYSQSSTPTIGDGRGTKVQIGSGTGIFSQSITGLSSGTKYYVRSYAINSEGTSYGSEENFTTSSGEAPTELSPGDIIILNMGGDNDDDFSFMPLVDLAEGTEIHFTDDEWNATTGSFAGTTEYTTYLVPTGGVVAGTIIHNNDNNIDGSINPDFVYFDDYDASSVSISERRYIGSFSTSGDQLLVFQGTYESPSFITALSTRGTTDATIVADWSSNSASYSNSDLPTGLTDGVNALVVISTSSDNWDNVWYNGPMTAADKETWQARIADLSNWTGTGDAASMVIHKDLTLEVNTGPTVSSVSLPTDGYYVASDNMDFTVTFSEAVTVNSTGGTPTLPVTLDTGGAVAASYVSGSGTTDLVFRYTVVTGNLDSDGISLGTDIDLNGATVQNGDGDDASLTLSGVPSATGVKVDAVIPTVTNVSSSTADGTYKTADVITITVTFGEVVNATGTPTISLNSGGSGEYNSGSGTTTLTFNYTIGSSESISDLDYSSTTALALAGGTIKDIANNSATLTLPTVGGSSSIAGQKDIEIGIVPTVTTQAASNVNTTTATGNGNLTGLGFPDPTQYGFVWSTSTGPTTALSTKSEKGAVSSIGAFTTNITDLSPDTKYYIRAYATNNAGTSYGNEVSFTTDALTLSVSSNSVSLAKSAGSNESVDVTSNTTWTASSDESWLTVDPATATTGDASLSMTATENPGTTDRTANVTLSATGVSSETIVVTQSGNIPLTITDPTLTLTKVYDGTTTAAVTPGSLTNLESGDEVNVSAMADYDTKTVGESKTITVSYSISGSDASKYTAPEDYVVTTGVITTKAITVTANASQSKVYGEDDPSFTYSVAPDIISGDAFTGELAREVGDTVGIYTYRIGTLSAGGNYSITLDSVDFSITKKPITVTADANQSKIYGEDDPAFTYIVSPDLVTGDAFEGALTRDSGADAGTYAITLGDLTAGNNYDISFVSKDFTIKPKPITVTADADQSKIYGESDPVFSYTASPELFQGHSFLGALSRTSGEDVGTYAISEGTLSASSNYSISFVSKDFTIEEKEITITPDVAQTKVYGSSDPASFTYTNSPDLEGTDSFTGSLTRETGDTVGIYTYRLGTLTAGSNYSLVLDSVDFSITKNSITVTADANQSKTYGESDPTFTYAVTPELESGDSFTGYLSRDLGQDVGSYAITQGTLSAGNNYDISFTSNDFSITKKSITVTAKTGQGKTYGESDPAFTYDVSPSLISGDAFTGELSRDEGEDVGAYAITQGTLSAGSNYDLSFTSNDFSIAKKAITVTADEGQSKEYSDSDPTLTYSVTPELISGDTFAGFLSRDEGEAVGSYAITQGTLTVSSNYDLNFVSKDFTVIQKSITVTADENQIKVFGEYDPTFTYTASPSLASGDAFSGELSRAAGEDLGKYAIEIGTLTAGSNYDVSFVSKDFTIVNKIITVTVLNANPTKIYGEEDPEFTYEYSPDLESSDSFTGALARSVGEDVGKYAITLGTLSAGDNYLLKLEKDSLSISSKPITITADTDQSKVYGDSDPSLTYTVSPELITGDAFTGSLSRESGEDVGDYAITQGTLSPGENYSVSFTSNDFTITKKVVTITPEASQNKIYGDADPQFTYQYSPDLIVGDEFTGELTREQGDTVGIYTYRIGSLSAGGNYQLAIDSIDFTINKKSITVTADADQSKVYGESDPVLTYSVSPELEEGDAFSGALTRIAGEDVASYLIEVGDLSAGSNYDMSFNGDDFAITQLQIAVTPDADQSKIYGESDPTFGYAINPSLVDGDGISGFLAREAGDTVGIYTYQIGTLSAGDNYNLVLDSVDFAIIKKEITITPDANQAKVYGDTDPTLTYTSSDELEEGDEFTGALERSSGEDAGAYAINLGTLSAGDNYSLSVADDDFTITQKAITVTADSDQRKIYGEADPVFTYSVSPALIDGDEFTGALSRSAGEDVNTYGIVIGSLTAGDNYDLSYAGADFSITKKAITVTADSDQSKTYGELDSVFTYSVSPALIDGDAFSGALVRDTGEDVGTYAIKEGTLSAGTNYNMAYVGADFGITQKTIMVSANADQGKVYGESDQTLTYDYSPELIEGDAFSGSLSREAGEDVGTYAIQQGDLSLSNNYTITYAGDEFTISAKAITVTADSQTKTYNDADPILSYGVSPVLIEGDLFSGALSRESGEDVGSYTILQGSLSAGNNYKISYVADSLTITPMQMTIADPEVETSKVYDGTTVVDVTAAAPDLIGDDIVEVVATAEYDNPLVGTGKLITVSYSISGADSENYITPEDYSTNSGEITAKALSISAPEVTLIKMYDGTASADIIELGELSGLISADMTNVSVNATATYDNAEIADGKTVTVSYALSGNASTNYTVPESITLTGAKILDEISLDEEGISIPLVGGCQGENLYLSYTIEAGEPVEYKITFSELAQTAGFEDVEYTALPSTVGNDSIYITVPDDMQEGVYEAEVTFRNEIAEDSVVVGLAFTINLSKAYIVTKFDDVLVCDNSSLRFDAYQWYKDGMAITGATEQFLYQPGGLDGSYHLVVKSGEDTYRTCVKVFNNLTNKDVSLDVYPNPAVRNETLTVRLHNMTDTDLEGAVMSIYNMRGIKIKQLDEVHSLNEVKLPVGVYVGTVNTADGNQIVFRISVIN